MDFTAKFGHTNLIAADWRRLADFYQHVFGCVPVPPERDLQGTVMERGTGIPGAHLRGLHLRLPGFGPDGPTLEIFTYTENAARVPAVTNRPGFGHIAFIVSDLESARRGVLAAGGSAHGELVTTSAGPRTVSWIYLCDPEGNLIELQKWAD